MFQFAQSSWSNQTAWIQGWCDGLLYSLRRDYSEIMAEHSDDADTFEYDGVGYVFEPEYNDEELEAQPALRRRGRWCRRRSVLEHSHSLLFVHNATCAETTASL